MIMPGKTTSPSSSAYITIQTQAGQNTAVNSDLACPGGTLMMRFEGRPCVTACKCQQMASMWMTCPLKTPPAIIEDSPE
jgi:hypothetical protein